MDKHDKLVGLTLVFGNCRDHQPQPKAAENEQEGHASEKCQIPLEGNMENEDPGDEDGNQINYSDAKVGDYFGRHQFKWTDRCDQQLFHSSLLPFTYNGSSCKRDCLHL